MVDIGKTLRKARENKNLSIQDVASQTLIREYYLEKIETNEFGSEYDGFINAYIKNYATFLGLDSVQLSNAYKELFKRQVEEEKAPIHKKKKNYVIILSIVTIILAIIISVIFLKPRKSTLKQTPISNTPVTTPMEKQPTKTPPVTTKPKENARGIDIVVSADARCWMGVTIDGKYETLFINKGEKKEFKGEKYVKIRFGNARHVYVTENGKYIGKVSKNKDVVEVTYKP